MWLDISTLHSPARSGSRLVPAIVALTMVGTGWGCSSGSGAVTLGESVRGADSGTVFVRVDNRNDRDLRIYLVRGSTNIGLGRVGSFETRTFRVRGSMLGGGGQIELLAQPLAGTTGTRLQPTPISFGQQLEWRLEPFLRNSSVMVRQIRWEGPNALESS